MPYVKRKGVSIVECVILIIVLVVAIGAIFETTALAQRNYTSTKLERDSRNVLFNWVQTFESLWPPDGMNPHNAADASGAALVCIEQVGNMLGTYSASERLTRIGALTVVATPSAPVGGSMGLNIVIRGSGSSRRSSPLLNLTRVYNLYTTETVSDDVLVGGS